MPKKKQATIIVRPVLEADRVPNDMFDKLSFDMQTMVCGMGAAFLYQHVPIAAEAAENDERGVEGLVVALLNEGVIEMFVVGDDDK